MHGKYFGVAVGLINTEIRVLPSPAEEPLFLLISVHYSNTYPG